MYHYEFQDICIEFLSTCYLVQKLLHIAISEKA
jgi:hypothetical protein